jgi:hypothetical protein
MPNPFRHEQDAFRMLVMFMVGAAIVIAATVITGSSVVGLVVAFILVCLAAAKLWVDYVRWRAERDREVGEGPA